MDLPMSSNHRLIYKEVYDLARLQKAWTIVRASAFSSASNQIREEAVRFEKNLIVNIMQIQSDLRNKSFKFDQQKGVAVKRINKTPRPLVVSSVRNKIVQRVILDVSQEKIYFVKKVMEFDRSFGGLKDKNVEKAVFYIQDLRRSGKVFFFRSDIPSFFNNINKNILIDRLSREVIDQDFLLLLESAITTDLSNAQDLKSKGYLDVFPLDEIGVAQGSALSPLLANIYLYDFDVKLKESGVDCIRYIDDFVIMGKTKENVDNGADLASKILKSIGLDSYTPDRNPEKSSVGNINEKPMVFLGCRMTGGMVCPSSENILRFRNKIDEITKKALRDLKKFVFSKDKLDVEFYNYVQSLTDLRFLVQGWGHAFRFSNQKQVILSVDKFLISRINNFEAKASSIIQMADDHKKAKILGVPLFSDICNTKKTAPT